MKNPRMIMPLGMACLVLAITWPSFSHPVSRMPKTGLMGGVVCSPGSAAAATRKVIRVSSARISSLLRRTRDQ